MSVLSVLLCLSLIPYTCSIQGVSIHDLDKDDALLTLSSRENVSCASVTCLPTHRGLTSRNYFTQKAISVPLIDRLTTCERCNESRNILALGPWMVSPDLLHAASLDMNCVYYSWV